MSTPFPRLAEQFHRLHARATRGDATPELVLEALAHAAGLAVFTGLSEVPVSERKGLIRKGRRTILSAGPGSGDEEEAEDLAWAAALAKAGLAALDGADVEALTGPSESTSSSRWTPRRCDAGRARRLLPGERRASPHTLS